MRAVLFTLGAIVFSFISYGAIRIHGRNVALQQQLSGLQTQVASLEAENIRFQEDIDFYSQPENLEKEARARLNLKKPGETLVIIPRGTQKNSSGSDAEAGIGGEKPHGLWQRMKDFFSKN
jgi:cell division protein FtsB